MQYQVKNAFFVTRRNFIKCNKKWGLKFKVFFSLIFVSLIRLIKLWKTYFLLSVRKWVRFAQYLSVCSSLCLSISLSICLSVRLSVHQSVRLSFRMSFNLSVYLSVGLSLSPSVCPSVCLSIYSFLEGPRGNGFDSLKECTTFVYYIYVLCQLWMMSFLFNLNPRDFY